LQPNFDKPRPQATTAMDGEAPKGGQWTAAMPQDSYTDLEEKLARAQRERDEALEQQRATAEVLRVISSSPGDLEPVFQAMLENATRICEAKLGILFLSTGDGFHTAAMHNAPPALVEARRREPLFRPPPTSALGQMAANKRPTQMPTTPAPASAWAAGPGAARGRSR
jgi:hypothetical protein